MRIISKTIFSMLSALLLCFLPFLNNTALAASDYSIEILPEESVSGYRQAARDPSWYTEEAVYDRLMAMQSGYPEGMPYTNNDSYENTYLWHGGEYDGYNVHYTGRGCAAFALIMSDAAFGSDMPLWQEYNVSFSNVRVGDILRIDNDSHSVIILQVNQDSVTIAEGNYNSSIHWGRTLSSQAVENADYLFTRWPGVPQPSTYTVSYDANGGMGAPAAQTKKQGESITLSNVRPGRDGQFFVGWAESASAVTAVYQPGDTFSQNADTTLYAVWAIPDFILPASLTSIQDEAFAGGAFHFVKLSERTLSIGEDAFANCRNLLYIYIPAATEDINQKAFGETPTLSIIGQSGSAAEEFAFRHNCPFIAAS
ncbi:MAG: InlB B-repeat-containing protein [Oscillospiraceae bacterium]|nr:InlB B-repeat-containing protein [Oscillospiraceae bacterium]